jgi:hypothetical protein
MKKYLLLLCLAVAASYTASAQQKGKTGYMSITIYQYNNRIDNMIVTSTDSAQVNHSLKIKVGSGATGKGLAQQDNALMTLIKPYLDGGWKLFSFAETQDNDMMNVAYKYFLSKDE